MRALAVLCALLVLPIWLPVPAAAGAEEGPAYGLPVLDGINLTAEAVAAYKMIGADGFAWKRPGESKARTAPLGRTNDNASRPYGAGFWETSEYMIGTVAVGVILTESNGSIDASTEDWTPAEETLVTQKVPAALDWWKAQEPKARLNFTYDWHYRVPTSYEPIRRRAQDEALWIDEAMTYLNYTNGTLEVRLMSYLNDLRNRTKSDWAYTIFVADSSNDADGQFADGVIAWALLGGPLVLMNYKNDGYGPGGMDRVVAHESGHIFYALDEYTRAGGSVNEVTGYLNVRNGNYNGVDCIMKYATWSVETWTRQQIGWRDTDNDGIMDIMDMEPAVLFPADPLFVNSTTPAIPGTAYAVPYPNRNPLLADPKDITLNNVSAVQYRVDGGAWQAAQAADGRFNEGEEAFVMNPVLSDGKHLIEARARHSWGNLQVNLTTLNVTVDTVPPSSIIEPLPAYTNIPSFTLAANATDGIGLKDVGVWYRRTAPNATNWTALGDNTFPPFIWNFDAASRGGDGRYEFYSRATDLAGNIEAAAVTRNTTVDTAPPKSDALALPSPVSVREFDVPFNMSDEWGVAAVSLYARREGGGWTQAGEWRGGPRESAGRLRFNISTLGTAAEGRYEFHTIATDLAGNREEPPRLADAFTVVDLTPPTATLATLPEYTRARTAGLDAASQDRYGVASVEFWSRRGGGENWSREAAAAEPPWTTTFNAGGEGYREFTVVPVDTAGNRGPLPSATARASTTFDWTPPATSIVPPPAVTANSTMPLEVSVTDIVPVKTVDLWVKKEGGDWAPFGTRTEAPWSFAFTAFEGDGTYHLYAAGTDAAGNAAPDPLSSSWNGSGVVSFVLDTRPPETSSAPLSAYLNATALLLSINASDDNGVSRVEVHLLREGEEWRLLGNATPVGDNYTFTGRFPADGRYRLRTRGIDSTGNGEPLPAEWTSPPEGVWPSRWVVVDTAPPALAVASPADGARMAPADALVVWSVEDNGSGLGAVEVLVDGAPRNVTPGSAFFVTELGSHALVIRASDRAGNSVSLARNFTVKTPKEPKSTVVVSDRTPLPLPLIGAALVIILAAVAAVLFLWRRKRRARAEPLPQPPEAATIINR